MAGNWCDHNSFSKFLLDWLTPTVQTTGSVARVLAASGTSKDALLIMPGADGTSFGEFYMAQNRHPVADDANLATQGMDGLLVWHVDARLNATGTDFLYDNSYTSHKLLRLMETDGLEQIEQNLVADAGDFYTPGSEFAPWTAPNSQDYASAVTGVVVGDIGSPGDSTSLSTAVIPQPTVTNPNTGGSFAQGAVVQVRWTIPAAVSSGSFRVYVQPATGAPVYLQSLYAVAGQTSYSYNWTIPLTQPVGTGYKILVYYADAAGNFLYYDYSNQPFAIS